MTSPYGPSGGNDPQQQWGQQPYGGGGYPGTPSGGFPAQQPGYGQPDPSQQQQQQWGQQQPPQQQQYTQQFPGGYDPTQQQQPQQNPYGQPDPSQQQWGQQQGQFGQPGYGQQNPYGQQPGYGTPPAKKSSALLWVIVGVLVLAIGAVLVLGFVTPGWFKKKIFDNTSVQNGIVQILKDDYKISDVESASCSGENPVEPNRTFTCKVKIGGKDKEVKITVKTADGEYEVGQPTG